MDAPTDWTYGGLVDWTSEDSLRLAPIQYVLRPIIEAIKERASVSNQTIPSILIDNFNPLYSVSNYINAIQTAMTTLLTFVNPQFSERDIFFKHTSDMDFTGHPPKWTESEALAETTINTRLTLKEIDILTSRWFYQQYELLNLMRELIGGFHTPYYAIYSSIYQANSEYYGGSGFTIAEVFADWKKFSGRPPSHGKWMYDDVYHEIHAAEGRFGLTVRWGYSYNPIMKINYSSTVDWWYKATSFFPGNPFDNFGDNVLNNVWQKRNSTNIPANTEIRNNNLVPENSNCPNRYTEDGYTGYSYTDKRVVIKPDFKFKNW